MDSLGCLLRLVMAVNIHQGTIQFDTGQNFSFQGQHPHQPQTESVEHEPLDCSLVPDLHLAL